MAKFLKGFGLGLVYIVLLPLLLVVLLAFAVYLFFVFLIQFFIGSVRFFQGKDAFPPLWEDEKVAEIKKAQVDAQTAQTQPAPVPQAAPAGPSTVYVQQNYYTGNGQKPGSEPATPPQANPTPIDTTGYFRSNSETPSIDATSTPSSLSRNPAQPSQIPQQSEPVAQPAGLIDLSHDDPDDDGGRK